MDKRLPVPYYKQEPGLKLLGPYQLPASNCGPACMQMVLAYLGWQIAAAMTSQQQQNDWLDDARDTNAALVPALLAGEDDYMCSPTGLQRTLNDEIQNLNAPK